MDQFKQMTDWKKNLDKFFGENFWNEFDGIIKPTIPQINMYQTENEIMCIVNIPGLNDLNQLNIYVDYATLELRGTIDLQHASGSVIKEEILQGVFEREISLPFPVRADKIKATYKNGLTFIQLHRLISDTSRKNKINVRLLEDE
ncbi:Hsp20/alpha crystallin family protein [Oceanobacillus chungangensis]|uniref:Hsp20/alpha crystallin family protein n=1 Tax=Oceanobacillus chungangensis TaxID=1229152 RepID=A0A3D8PS48_9BACI|nr:Hsp20/alpha crystallin family protein [Oceanobacillus chungangensis]RDW18943.1 Hsp20/alpha crystallin family protein [Oceanobacillus chungangensis]